MLRNPAVEKISEQANRRFTRAEAVCLREPGTFGVLQCRSHAPGSGALSERCFLMRCRGPFGLTVQAPCGSISEALGWCVHRFLELECAAKLLPSRERLPLSICLRRGGNASVLCVRASSCVSRLRMLQSRWRRCHGTRKTMTRKGEKGGGAGA